MGWQDAPEVELAPIEQAQQQMNLTSQERSLYQRHLDNLNGPGKVLHDDGSISTLYQMSIGGGNGRTYNIPSVYEGKILEPDEAIQRAKSAGLENFPSYGSSAEAEARYEQMHSYMDKDVGQYKSQPAWMKAPEIAPAAPEPPSALAVAGNAAWKGLAGVGDMAANVAGAVGNALIPPAFRPGAMQNPVSTALTAAGAIKPENEPQTPGQRILDMAVQAGVGTAIAPAAGIAGVAKNLAMGAVSGTAAGLTKEATGSDLAAVAAGVAAPLLAHAMVGSKANAPIINNPVKSATLKEAQAAGYVVPPSQVKPSFTTNKLEGIAGKAAVRQEASIRNQDVTNQLAAKAIGLPPETQITEGILNSVRAEAGQAYQAVADLSPTAESALNKLREVRQQATLYFKHYDRSADPASLTKAKNLNAEGTLLEYQLEREARTSGHPELIPDLKQARSLIARTHDIERALNIGDGNISARVIGRMLDQGKPLSGELKVIGRFAQAYPSVTREGASVPAPGVSGTDAFASAALGTMGYGAAGGPAGLIAAGLPLARGPARAAVLSSGYQARLLRNPPELNQAVLQSILAGRAIAEAH